METAILTNLDEGYDVEVEFNELLDELTDKEWENWCLGWFDKEMWVDIYKDWNEDLKQEAIDDFKEIIKNRKEKK